MALLNPKSQAAGLVGLLSARTFAGLLSALYTDSKQEVPNPDPTSGLYITGSSGTCIKAPIPPSHLAFQVGEAMQVRPITSPVAFCSLIAAVLVVLEVVKG